MPIHFCYNNFTYNHWLYGIKEKDIILVFMFPLQLLLQKFTDESRL